MVKTATSAAKTIALKTRAVTKVLVDALLALLMSEESEDLQKSTVSSLILQRAYGNTRTWWVGASAEDGRMEEERGRKECGERSSGSAV